MKKNNKKKSISDYGWLYVNNRLFLENFYQKFLLNPKKLNIYWRNIFSDISNTIDSKNNGTCNKIIQKNQNDISSNIFSKKTSYIHDQVCLQERFFNLINAYRFFGHQISKLNPLQYKKKNKIPELSKYFYNIQKEQLNRLINFDLLFFKKNSNSFKEVYLFFKKKYCSNIGFEYMHINNLKERKWLQDYIENNNLENFLLSHEKKELLKNLIKSTIFEKFIHTKFPGSKRFSLEGCDALIPALKTIIKFSFTKKIKKIFLGMAHRGRLNVMHNILNYNVLKMFQDSFQKYKEFNGTGDVKYHIGLKKKIQIKEKSIEINLLDNPSHLEIITPVVIGCCKFFIEKKYNFNNILPIIIHGDAAFSGQGVIQETLNMSQVPGYNVGGSIHIIINNQIAFTTSKKKYLRSSAYCTDIAKMIDSPIFHVNADHPESVIFVVLLALKFRFLFNKDVFIDLIGYRRLGHNEADDPYITQPYMYHLIKNHERVCSLYAKKIIKKENNNENLYNHLCHHFKKKLYIQLKSSPMIQKKLKILKKKYVLSEQLLPKRICSKTLKSIASQLFTLPKNFVMHQQVKKTFYNRTQMAVNKMKLDWGAIENLAYATLMYYGITCRLTGEDVGRGTFSHRHATIICQKNNTIYIPLKNLSKFPGSFYIWDSVLSEESVLGFEYGYSMVSNKLLNVWEAQFGDFSNGAQIIIDQFLVSSFQKWGYSSPLVILLPHGYEGQGPEHSSGRLERYLQLCAQKNIRICIPTTVSQMYHILLNQGWSYSRKPLIIFTPKSLLRNPLTFVSIKKLSDEKFHKILFIIPENKVNLINRVIFCSGKIYYELLNFYKKNKIMDTIIIRIEQLYPFPFVKINNILIKYPSLKNFVWCQEEPMNQGSWTYIYFYFKKYIFIKNNIKLLRYVGRSKLSSTAEGNFRDHQINQKKIIKKAFFVYK
ncbi:2-oxoglutarate dehydrogenase E1 component [Buchnera aphidicola]|uniref:oxoglutarate dehydrogenase (succinyl-transferring) n=1 Tax=Buchnera aphidicola (Cinara strobi) TaxID=1921549 RepID=A0A3B1DLG0_9GAMM|nr:2-oxoglutarate dehydrogenase E1 component [Buchnera aphidicola]VAX76541.1 2-oxoglutarate dehydrogenase E1 component [Buchnera aphidicola (Cinara strobi)]